MNILKVQLDSCASDVPAAGYGCSSRLSFIFCINPKFWSICNFCNKELKLCLLYVFSKMFSTCFWWDVAGLCTSHSFNLRFFSQQETMNLTKKCFILFLEIWPRVQFSLHQMEHFEECFIFHKTLQALESFWKGGWHALYGSASSSAWWIHWSNTRVGYHLL